MEKLMLLRLCCGLLGRFILLLLLEDGVVLLSYSVALGPLLEVLGQHGLGFNLLTLLIQGQIPH